MKISEMMQTIQDDTVVLEQEEAVDSEKIKNMVRQRIHNSLPAPKQNHPFRKFVALAVAAAMVLSLGTTALAVSQGRSIAELFRNWFAGELESEQETMLEELGTTDFAPDTSLSVEPEEEEPPLFSGVTRDGITVTPMAAVFDGYRLLFQVKIALPEGEVLPEATLDYQYTLAVQLHIIDQVWCPGPVEESFSKENCKENEIICTQDWQFCGEKVTLPNTVHVVALQVENKQTAPIDTIFEGEWPIDLSGLSAVEEVSMELTDQSFPVTIYNDEMEAVVSTSASLTHMMLSPLTVNLTYAYHEALPDDIFVRCWSDLRLDELTAVKKDGSTIPFQTGMADYSPSGGSCQFIAEQPLILSELDYLEIQGLRIPLSNP